MKNATATKKNVTKVNSKKINEKVETKVNPIENKLDELNKAEIKSDLTNKKFVGINYAEMSAKEQKRFRTKVRSKLFAIVNEYTLAKLQNKLPDELKTDIFAKFESFLKENYNLSKENCENCFKGSNDARRNDFMILVNDYKKA